MKLLCLRFVLAFALPLTVLAQDGAAPASAIPSVRVVKPTEVKEASSYSFPGRTEPNESARVFTRSTGIVRVRNVDIGDVVKAGSVLAEIDVPDLDRAVDAARANVELAKVRAANARTQAKRTEALVARKAISQEESDQRSADADAADAGVRVAEAELARLEEQQGFSIVRAPFDATVAARNFDRGDRVRGDSATSEGWLVYLIQLKKLRFAVNVAPDLAMRLAPETKARISFNELPGRVYESQVARTSRNFDTNTGTMRIELELDNANLELPSGLTGLAAFSITPFSGSYLVPLNTIVTRHGQPYLALVESGKVIFLPVSTGRNLGVNIEVVSEKLNAEAQVIINPNALLKEGDSVTVAPSTENK